MPSRSCPSQPEPAIIGSVGGRLSNRGLTASCGVRSLASRRPAPDFTTAKGGVHHDYCTATEAPPGTGIGLLHGPVWRQACWRPDVPVRPDVHLSLIHI